MKIKCIETFEYDLELPDGLDDTQISKQIWKVRDTVDCAAGMSTPFWDGYPCPEFVQETFIYDKIE